MRKLTVLATIILLRSAAPGHAEPLSLDKVPEPLRPWVQWVLDGREEARCPLLPEPGNSDSAARPCFWPGRLELAFDDREGRFRQEFQAYKEGWAALPGDAKRWPQDVKVDGRPAAAVSRQDGMALVRLTAGAHAVTGRFQWDSMPELMQVPRQTGLLGLSLRGKRVPFPNRDAEGRLWLQKAAGKQEGEDRLDVVVHRRVLDEIPLLLLTDIELKVSGKNRELLLGKALPPGFIPTALSGPLPARLERDGRLRVQARPGNWRMQVQARHEGPVAQLALPAAAAQAGPWAREEVWVFEAHPDLRLVSVEGVPSVDPQQTELPPSWRTLPAYRMRPGDAMRLVERRRGDSAPAQDQLSLRRTWWLDFDGGGYSIRDQVSGSLRRGWRLEMAQPTVLGRAAVNGQDQFITALKSAPGRPQAAGIEIRQGSVQLEADSRLPGSRWRVPAVGWSHDFHLVQASLNLPPGWRLFHAFGVDDASPTWISRWTLLDFFLVLMIALSVGKLWGRNWGLLALAAVALCYHETGAPRWVIIYLLAAEALARALPEGKLRKVCQACRMVFRLALVLMMVPFLISQVRVAMYPQLERPSLSAAGFGGGSFGFANVTPMISGAAGALSAGAPEEESAVEMDLSDEAPRRPAPAGLAKGFSAKARAMDSKIASMSSLYGRSNRSQNAAAENVRYYPLDPTAQVTTGPGMPTWQWNSVSLTWRGPVDQAQKMSLVLIGPFGNFVLALARIALLVILALCLMNLAAPGSWRAWSERLRRAPAAAWLLALCLALPGAARADMPSPDLLKDLQARLVRPPDCAPNCASISRLRLEASPESLRLRLEVSAGALTAVPLPGGDQQWSPSQVMLDDKPAPGLLRSQDGRLYLPVSAGTHQVSLEGPLPDRETVDLPLPLKPHRVEAKASGWTLGGVREDGVPEDNLQLTRVRGAKAGPSNQLQPGVLPPFLVVVREISLGLSWQVRTVVVRTTPPGAAVVADIPLLPGESVTSPEVRVEKGKAKVSMGPQVRETGWSSVLSQSEALRLKAPDSLQWTEVWRLDASPIWHVAPEGIPAVSAPDNAGPRRPEWRPWPGETVTVTVSRPEGVPGQTMTVDRSELSLSPGLRSTAAALELGLRSSRGAERTLTLPEGAELESLKMDGATQPARQEGRSVTLTVPPGSHQVSLAWRQPSGVKTFYRVPEVKLGLASVNSRVSVSLPSDRWVLSVWGPRLGPAVLFWSVLAVMLLLSLGLDQLGLAPLKTRDWFLLFVGLSQVPIPVAALVAGWLLALGIRKKNELTAAWRFDLVQVALGLWTIAALSGLFAAIRQGLLGQPEMQISGNGSTGSLLQWYQDRAAESLPRPGLFCLPRMFYRLAMLAWSLWIASSLIAWLKWGWSCVNAGGLWKAEAKTVKTG